MKKSIILVMIDDVKYDYWKKNTAFSIAKYLINILKLTCNTHLMFISKTKTIFWNFKKFY